MTTNDVTPEARLLQSLLAELFQSERSASRHPVVEAERLSDAPPALPMQLVAAHATRALGELELLTTARGIHAGAATTKLGGTFSAVRNRFADLALRREQSYRFTILGIRHGLDVVRELRALVSLMDDEELQRWTEQWFDERGQLLSRAEEALSWFKKRSPGSPRLQKSPLRRSRTR